MKREWDAINAARTEPVGFFWGVLVCNAWWVLVLVIVTALSGCVLFRPWAPSGHPPCPKGHAWNDSTLTCKEVPRDR